MVSTSTTFVEEVDLKIGDFHQTIKDKKTGKVTLQWKTPHKLMQRKNEQDYYPELLDEFTIPVFTA